MEDPGRQLFPPERILPVVRWRNFGLNLSSSLHRNQELRS